MERSATVLVPLLAPLPHEEITAPAYRKAIAALEVLTSLPGKLWGEDVVLTTSLISSPETITELADRWTPHFREQCVLRFDATVHVDIEEYLIRLKKNNPRTADEIDEESAVRWAGDLLAEDVAQVTGHLITALNIALPGSIRTNRRFLLCDGLVVRVARGLGADLEQVLSRSRTLGWPPYCDPALEDVWAWITKIDGLEDGAPKGAAGRAVAAFSELMDGYATDPAIGLMWALVGLEALYAKGSQGLKAQLMEKSEIVLGPRRGHKKAFGRMYDFRSRFIHGDVDFDLAYAEATEAGLALYNEASAATEIAIAMLLATLQQLVERQLYALSFSYALDND